MRLIYPILSICILLLSCKKNASDSQSFFECEYQYPDSSTLAEKLPCRWKWIKTHTIGTRSNIKSADKLRVLTFMTDSTFSYVEEAVILAEGKWSLKVTPGTSYWNLILEPESHYLMGNVFFCNHQMGIFYSAADGEDVLFEKIN